MDQVREILIVGLSHHRAPVEVRELVALAPAVLPETLARLRSEVSGCREAWALSTCNRTEIALVSDDPWVAEAELRAALFARVDQDQLYAHHGTDAVFHLFRVAAGLDSLVLGESQILGQIRQASELARGTLAEVLTPLLDQSLAVGKRVRTETKVGEGTLSVARAAVELATKVLGPVHEVRATLVGAGETGQLVAKHLVDAGARGIAFVNRTLERAEEAARTFDGTAHPLSAMEEVLKATDLLVVSVDALEPIVHAKHFRSARLGRRDRIPLVIDLSIPRAVDPEVGRLDLLLHDVDDLAAIVAAHHDERRQEVRRAEVILVQEVHKFLALRAYQAMKPVIMGLEERFAALTASVLLESQAAESRADFAERLKRRLLAEARACLKEGARHTFSPEVLDRLYKSHRRKDP